MKSTEPDFATLEDLAIFAEQLRALAKTQGADRLFAEALNQTANSFVSFIDMAQLHIAHMEKCLEQLNALWAAPVEFDVILPEESEGVH